MKRGQLRLGVDERVLTDGQIVVFSAWRVFSYGGKETKGDKGQQTTDKRRQTIVH